MPYGIPPLKHIRPWSVWREPKLAMCGDIVGRASRIDSCALFAIFILQCDPIQSTGIVVTPLTQTPVAVGSRSLQIEQDVAQRYRLHPSARPLRSWQQCDERGHLSICHRPSPGGAEFALLEVYQYQWSPFADSVRHDLLTSLRQVFGDSAVRECRLIAIKQGSRPACGE